MSSTAWNKLFQETEIIISDGQNLAQAAKNIQELRKDGVRIGGPVYSKRIKQLSDSLEIQKSLAQGDLVQAQKILKMSGRAILPEVRAAVEQAQARKIKPRPTTPSKKPIVREEPITQPVRVEKEKKPIVRLEPEAEKPIEEQPIFQPIQEPTPRQELPAPKIIQQPEKAGMQEPDLSEEAIEKLLLEHAVKEGEMPAEPEVGLIKEEPEKVSREEEEIGKLLEEAAGWEGEEPSTAPKEESATAEQKRKEEEERAKIELERKRKEVEELEKSLTMLRVQITLFEKEYEQALAKVQGIKNFISQQYYNKLNTEFVVAQMERTRVEATRQAKIAQEQLQTTQTDAQKIVALIPSEHHAMIAGVRQKLAHIQSLVQEIEQLYENSNKKFQEILNTQEQVAEATRVAEESKKKIEEEAYKSASQEQKKLLSIGTEVAKINEFMTQEQHDLLDLEITPAIDIVALKQRRELAHTQALLAQAKVEEALSVLKAIEGFLGKFTASESSLERKKFREIQSSVEHIQKLDDQNKIKVQEIEREQQRLVQERAVKERVPTEEAARMLPETPLPVVVNPEPAKQEEVIPVIPATSVPAKEIGIGEGSKIKSPVAGELSPAGKQSRPRRRKPRVSPEFVKITQNLNEIKDKIESKYVELQNITITPDLDIEQLQKQYSVKEEIASAKVLQEQARQLVAKAGGDTASTDALKNINQLVMTIEGFSVKIDVLLRNIAQKQTDLAEAKRKEEASKQTEERKKIEDVKRNVEAAQTEENKLGPVYSQLQELFAAAEKACKDTGDLIFGRGWAQPSVGVIVSAKNKYIEAKNKRQEMVSDQLVQAEAIGKRMSELDPVNVKATQILGTIRDLAANIKRVDDACVQQLQQWEDQRRENRAITK